MQVVHDIIAKLGGSTGVAAKTGIPQQTVSEWANREPPEIPPWRRPAVLDALKRDGKDSEVPAEAIAYLASTQRTPKARAAA